jgi:hypothetical protein
MRAGDSSEIRQSKPVKAAADQPQRRWRMSEVRTDIAHGTQ